MTIIATTFTYRGTEYGHLVLADTDENGQALDPVCVEAEAPECDYCGNLADDHPIEMTFGDKTFAYCAAHVQRSCKCDLPRPT